MQLQMCATYSNQENEISGAYARVELILVTA